MIEPTQNQLEFYKFLHLTLKFDLTPKQIKHFIWRYHCNISFPKIGTLEETSRQNIGRSVHTAIKKMKNQTDIIRKLKMELEVIE